MSDGAVIGALSKRELEVAQAYASGESYKEIARTLSLSPTTVRSHLRTVYGKLGVTSKIELAQTLNDQSGPRDKRDRSDMAAELALELDEAVRRERNLAKVLKIISREDTDLDAAMDAVLETALEICEAEFGILFEYKGDFRFRELHSLNISPAFAKWLADEGTFKVDPGTGIGRVVKELQTVNIADVRGEDIYQSGSPLRLATADLGRARSFASIPMMAGGRLIGAFTVYRTRVHPFNDRALEMAQVFADQAVIAIENVRRFRELQTRLEREAVNREILRVISESPDDEQPVFDFILENACRLCEADVGAFVMGHKGGGPQVMVATTDATEQTLELYRNGQFTMEAGRSNAADAILQRKVIQVEDLSTHPLYRQGDARMRYLVDGQGIRTNLYVPLIANGAGIGCLILWRREVRPYTDDQIALVETFAAQAVIAIENTRRFRALQTRLESAQSNREILRVINESRANEQPVFEVITRNAVDLCNAQFCMLWRYDGTDVHYCASSGFTTGFMDQYLVDYPKLPEPNGIVYQVIQAERSVHLPNAQAEPYSDAAVARQHGYDYMLGIPINTGEGIWGIMVLAWPKGLSPGADQVELLETFAAQAAIAIENASQFRALQARLDRAAATREILEAIRDSRNDAAPVLDVILHRAARLCGADAAALTLGRAGENHQRLAAAQDMHPKTRALYQDGKVSMNPETSLVARAIVMGKALHVPDYADTDDYRSGEEVFCSLVDDTGMRTSVNVPLMSAGEGIGALVLYRKTVNPYAPDQIALVETFAAQAVIAIENAEQFRALATLNASLEARVEDQVSEIERMGRLKQFLSPAVADALVSSGDEARLSSHRALIATLFCDIRGFTAFCERAEPEETIEVLQAYHEEMGELISTYGGGVDKRIGDGIMVVFNDPLPSDHPAGDALRLAIAMRARMVELCEGWKRHGHQLGFGVGISLGYATIGMVGSEGRYDYTASGTSVNLASRLCDRAEDGEILLSPRAFTAVEDDFSVESNGEIHLKGLREPVEVFRLKA